MPHYYKTQIAHFEIETKPMCFLRRWFTYFVGKRVKFKIMINNTRDIIDSTTLYLVESFCGEEKEIKQYNKIANQQIEIYSGNRIDGEGEIKYKIGTSTNSHYLTTIFDCKSYNARDRWSIGCISCLVGFFSAIAVGIILGFIEIEPFIRILFKNTQ